MASQPAAEGECAEQQRFETLIGVEYVCDEDGIATVQDGRELDRMAWADVLTTRHWSGRSVEYLDLYAQGRRLRCVLTSVPDREDFERAVQRRLASREEELRGEPTIVFTYPAPLLRPMLAGAVLLALAAVALTAYLLGKAPPVLGEVGGPADLADSLRRGHVLAYAALVLALGLAPAIVAVELFRMWRCMRRSAPLALRSRTVVTAAGTEREQALPLADVVAVRHTGPRLHLRTAQGRGLLVCCHLLSHGELFAEELRRRLAAAGARYQERGGPRWRALLLRVALYGALAALVCLVLVALARLTG